MRKPWILGIASSHNGAVCLLHGNRIVVAIQEERLLRHKRAAHLGAFPSLAIQYCLDAAGIGAADLQAIALCAADTPLKPEEDVRANPQLDGAHRTADFFAIPHHLGHAVAAYAMSGRQDASVVVADGHGSFWQDLSREERKAVPFPQLVRAFGDAGGLHVDGTEVYSSTDSQPREAVSMYSAQSGKFTALEKHITLHVPALPAVSMRPFASLGEMYEAVGLQIFGQLFDGPGKVMGLAPYGRPTIPIEEFYRITDWGLEFQSAARLRFQHNDRWPRRKEEYQNLAASVQIAIEEGLLAFFERLRRLCSNPCVCYSGGVALNSVANERIVNETGVDDVFIMPAAEDSGTCIGAAYYALWQINGYTPTPTQHIDSVGKTYSRKEISQAMASSPGINHSAPVRAMDVVCELLAAGKIVGWFQGGSELGPRSLGQRSILCDPRDARMKEILNERVKFREPFRPFAPAILEEDVQEWFDVHPLQKASPFMLRVMRFWPEQAAKVPAVVHVDGTGRVQTVCRDFSPQLHALLTSWKRRTGIPILLNTSFNIAGEPIVETPEDAIWCMTFTQMDCCVLTDHLVSKTLGEDSLLDLVVMPTYKAFSLYDAANVQNSTINIPPLATANEFTMSVHTSGVNYVAGRSKVDHLRIVVQKPWGEAAHGMSPAYLRILDLVDGRRTARAILELLVSASEPGPIPYTISRFRRHLGILRRAGAIRFLDSRGKTESASLQKVLQHVR